MCKYDSACITYYRAYIIVMVIVFCGPKPSPTLNQKSQKKVYKYIYDIRMCFKETSSK